jgi:hypothetical protein
LIRATDERNDDRDLLSLGGDDAMTPFHALRGARAAAAPLAVAPLAVALLFGACGGSDAPTLTDEPQAAILPQSAPAAQEAVPDIIEMGGAKSVTTFFITSVGSGRGGDLGGLAGADAHCQALAEAEYAGDHTWRAYLSTVATTTTPTVHARDRIGTGPWYNAEGMLIAANVAALHGDGNRVSKERATTERLDPVNGVGDDPNRHDILTGSLPDGTALDDGEDRTCGNWTSSGEGSAQMGHHDRTGRGDGVNSWNSEHPSRGCSQDDLVATGGDGLFYCFAID